MLDKVNKETGMQIKNYETQNQELKSAVQSLEEGSYGSVISNQTSLLQTSRTAKLFITKLEELLAKVQQGK